MRTLVRRMAREGWRISQQQFDLDDSGYGTAVYRISTPIDAIHFVAHKCLRVPQNDSGFVLNGSESEFASLDR